LLLLNKIFEELQLIAAELTGLKKQVTENTKALKDKAPRHGWLIYQNLAGTYRAYDPPSNNRD